MHDARGRILKAGDLVLVPCRIAELHATEDYCNVSLRTIAGRRPDGMLETIYAINTGVLYRANDGDDNPLAELLAPTIDAKAVTA